MRSANRVRLLGLALLGALSASAVVTSVVLAAPAKPDYSLGIAPSSQSVQQGQTAAFTVSVTGSGGFTGSVALSATGLPSGATATFSPATANVTATAAGTSMLSVVTARTTPPGTSTLTITGTNGSTKRSVTATLTITYALNGSFSLSASPSSVSVAPGSTAVYGITLTRTAPFTGAVALAPYGTWPNGTSGTFDPQTIPPTGTTSTLQVATTAATANGTYTIYVVGTYTDAVGHRFQQYTQAQLVIDTKLSAKPFTISGDASSALAPGQPNQPLNLAITNPNNQTLNVTNLTVTLSRTSSASCPLNNYAINQFSGTYPLRVPANATNVTLSTLGVPAAQQPQLRMLDLATNQDGCKGVVLTLAYSGSGQG